MNAELDRRKAYKLMSDKEKAKHLALNNLKLLAFTVQLLGIYEDDQDESGMEAVRTIQEFIDNGYKNEP